MEKRRWWVIAMTISVIVLSGIMASRFHFEEDITAMLPDADPVVQDFRLVVKSFKSLDSLYIDIGSDSDPVEAEEHIIAVADGLYEALSESELFSSIDYRFSSEQLVNFYNAVSSRMVSLLGAGDLSELATTLTPEEIDSRLAAAKRNLIEPGGLFIREQIRRDPLGLGNLILSKLEQINSDTQAAQIIDGRIWSGDLKHILMIAVPKFPATDSKRGEQLISLVDDARQQALQLAPAGMVRISYVGGHRATLDNAKTIKSDVSKAMTVASIGIAVIGILFFRRKLYVLLIFLPVIWGIALAMIVFAVVQPTISAISVGCAVVLVGIVVDYGVHFLYRWDNIWFPQGGGPSRESMTPRRCVRSMFLPLLMGAGTTISGLLCLLLSSLPGQRQMGIFGALGVLGSVLFVMFFLPYLISPSRSPRRRRVLGTPFGLRKAGVRHLFAKWGPLPLVDYCHRFLTWRQQHGRVFGILTVAVLVIGVIGLSRLRFEGDPQKLNYLLPESMEDEKQLLQTWGDFSTTSVVVRGKTLEGALQKNDRMVERLQELVEAGKISSFSSISFVLPSEETQLANQKRWRQFWGSKEGADMVAHFKRKASELGFKPNAFQPFYQTLQDECGVVSVETFAKSGLDRLIRTHVATGEDEFLVMSTFVPKNQETKEEITSVVAEQADTIVTNKESFVEHATGLVRAELQRLAGFACLAIMAFMFLFLRRVELLLSVILPVCFGFIVTLGVLGFLGIPINLIGCLFIVFVFGVGIDYSIFLTNAALDVYRGRGEHVGTTFGSVLICALTTMCSFGALSFAKHPGLYSLGVTGLVGMMSCLAMAVLVVPMISNYLLPAESKYGAPTLRTVSAAIWSFFYLGGAGLLYVCFLRYLAILRYYKKPLQRQRFVRRFIHRVGRGLVRFFPFPGTRGIYLNCSKKGFSKAAVIVSNHLSGLDIMAILALPADMVMMVKRWVWDAPIMGLIIQDAGYILVDDNDAESILAKAASYLKRGVSVMIFPEGTRSRNGEMQRFHKGAFELAVRAGSDIIPVLISDSQSCLAPQTHWIGYSQTVVRVLPRVTPENFDYSRGVRELCDEVRSRMRAFVREDWRLAQEGKAFWRNIRALYNYLGAYVESYIAWKLHLDPIYHGIDGLVPERGSILDLGCGYGLMTNVLARKSPQRQLTGVDFDGRKIRVAQQSARRNENISFELQDLLDWEYPEVEAVILVDVLHYWSEQKQRSILSKTCRCLRSGGVLVFRDGLACSGLRHRLVSWSEHLSCLVGQNRRGDGLFFGDRDFYTDAFESEGLRLSGELTDLGHGSNTVLIYKKVS